MTMRKINVKLDKEKLSESIDYLFFQNDSKGKRIESRKIEIKKGEPAFTMLHDMDEYQARVESVIIDGGMMFDIKSNDESVELTPKNQFCVLRKNKYSFY